MDPNLFALDVQRLGEVLLAVIVLSFFVERSLSLLFEHRVYVQRFKGRGFKEPIALIVSVAVCWAWQFDALSIVFVADQMNWVGYFVTGAIIAGGSKASIRLFHDLWGVMSTAKREVRSDDAPTR